MLRFKRTLEYPKKAIAVNTKLDTISVVGGEDAVMTIHRRKVRWTALARAMCCVLAASLWVGASSWVAAQPRTAKVAGQFYPEEPAELLDVVQYLLNRQPEPATPQKPRILIIPHAGYQYSGLIAANGFRQVQGQRYDGVVVVAFTHRMQFPGASVDDRESYETPLGEIPVDQEAVAVLQTYPGIGHVEEAHESNEHSLEVELPFLQVTLKRFKLVPILMGTANLEDARHLAAALAALATLKDYLFVFSTDLSHYHPYSEAETIDERTISATLFETPQAVNRLFQAGELEACGRGPILTSLFLAERLGYPKRQLLYRANSGDTMGNPSSVVGYAAIGMFGQNRLSSLGLSQKAGEALVAAARQSLAHSLAKRGQDPSQLLRRYPELSRPSGLFVTLRKGAALRGCIGRIQTAEPLAKSLPKVAVDAAVHDGRFAPVSAEELPDLRVEVSVLTPPAPVTHPDEIVPGRDGVVLEYQGHSGVFLPQVWEETGWTRIEFLRELASQKAGLPPDAWQQAALSIFQAQVFEEPDADH